MKGLVNFLVKNKKECFFVSPHLDDAILSCGELIKSISQVCDVTVVNIFTKGGDKNSLSAQKNLKSSGFESSSDLYKARVEEDAKALKSIHVKQINLGLNEALWREKRNLSKTEKILTQLIPEIGLIYPNYKFNIIKGKLSKLDKDCLNETSSRLKALIPKNAVVFCPIGIGDHVDHVFTKKAVERVFNPIYWLDQPYAKRLKSENKKIEGLKKIYQIDATSEKKKIIQMYKTQVASLFDNAKVPFLNENYFKKEKKYYEIKLYKTVTPELLSKWNNLWENSAFAHFFNSYKWFETLCKVFPDMKYKIITLEKKGKIEALLTLSEENLYGVEVLTSPGSKFTDKSSLLLRILDKNLIANFLKELQKHGNVVINELPEEIFKIISEDTKYKIIKSNANFQLQFEDNPFRFLAREQKRKINKVLTQNNKKINFLMSNGDLKLLKIAKKIDSSSYKDKKNIGTFKDSLNEKFLSELVKNNPNSAKINLLKFKGKAISYEIGIMSNNVYYGINKSFDNKYKYLAPGKITIYLLLQHLFKDGIKKIDMARGEDMLKRTFSKDVKRQHDLIYTKPEILSLYISFMKNTREKLVQNQLFYKSYRKALNLLT